MISKWDQKQKLYMKSSNYAAPYHTLTIKYNNHSPHPLLIYKFYVLGRVNQEDKYITKDGELSTFYLNYKIRK